MQHSFIITRVFFLYFPVRMHGDFDPLLTEHAKYVCALWWVNLSWMPSVHQAGLSLLQEDVGEENMMEKKLCVKTKAV